jgi:tRNA modification GTPase
LASGPPPAGVAVIRLSGPGAEAALAALGVSGLKPREATLRRLRDSQRQEILDEALVIWFPAPASYTGEDVAEIHLHGGRAVIEAVTGALSRLPGLAPAEPGEFTRRAFLNGKLDLTQAEGIADLIDAETEAQRRQALRQTEGWLGDVYERWRAGLMGALAHLEADIDFAEDDELPSGLADSVVDGLADLRAEIAGHLADGHRGERLREGVYVVIVGPPNVGKSSLLNALAQRDAAIVSSLAGTTRDVIEVHLDLGGVPVIVADTAGLRAASDAGVGEVEHEGVRRALARAEAADLKIVVVEAGAWPPTDAHTLALIDENAIVVVNKIDLQPVEMGPEFRRRPVFPLSVRTNDGVARMIQALTEIVVQNFGLSAAPGLTRQRHRAALEACLASLERYLTTRHEAASELVAEDIRLAARALGGITGRIDVEDLLDIVFRDFCIGK